MLRELWSDVRYRVRALVRRDELERELDAELDFHLRREAEKYERAGMAPAEARRRARIAFGGIDGAKEASRDGRGTVLVETIVQDLRYALRGLRGKPVFTAGVVVTLALGIGANVAMFGIVDRLMFRPPAFLRDPATVGRVYFERTLNHEPITDRAMQYLRYRDFLQLTRSFSSMASFATWHLAVGDGDQVRERSVTAATVNYFDFFDARPALGRFFVPGEDTLPAGVPVAVLGYEFWQLEFGGRRDVLGERLRIGRTLYTIVGVAPEHFTGFSDEGSDEVVPSAFIPLTAFAADVRPGRFFTSYSFQTFQIVARRKPGIGSKAADADLDQAFVASFRRQLATDHDDRTIESLRPRAWLGPIEVERGPSAGPEARVALWIAGVAVVVLLIACANVANLLLARAIGRRREIALRLALGVSRGRLARQLLSESLVLAALGCACGLAVARWGAASVRALFLSGAAADGAVIDRRSLLVAIAIGAGVALLTGIAPVLQATGSGVQHALGADGRDAGVTRSRARTTLLLLQATLSVVLLIGAGLFVRSLQHAYALRLGYDAPSLLVVVDNPRGVKMTRAERRELERRLVEESRVLPGVQDATPAASIPMWGYEGRSLFVPGLDSVDNLGNFLLQTGNADYFRTVGTRILRGRAFDDTDREGGPLVMVIGEGMGKLLWPGQDPIGRCIRIRADTAPCRTVIGIAEDIRLMSFGGRRDFAYYIPWSQYDDATGMLFVRVAGRASDQADIVRRQLQRAMPGNSYVSARPMEQIIDPERKSWRLGATMFVAFGGLALVLAGIGLYSVIAYGVAQRRRELGVRIALGATQTQVVRLVVRGGLRLVVAGVVLGSLIALLAGRWIAALLFQESPADPLIYAGVAALLIGVALLATAFPARAAARVDPNIALRAE